MRSHRRMQVQHAPCIEIYRLKRDVTRATTCGTHITQTVSYLASEGREVQALNGPKYTLSAAHINECYRLTTSFQFPFCPPRACGYIDPESCRVLALRFSSSFVHSPTLDARSSLSSQCAPCNIDAVSLPHPREPNGRTSGGPICTRAAVARSSAVGESHSKRD